MTSDLESLVETSYATIFVWTVQACFGPFFELRPEERRTQLASTRPAGFAAGKNFGSLHFLV